MKTNSLQADMKIRLATFNLFQFAAPPCCWYHPDNHYKNNEWEDKLSWLQSTLTNMDADIIGFQEVFSIDALRQLCLDCGYPHFVTLQAPQEITTSPLVMKDPVVAMASRHPIDSAQSVTFQPELLKAMSLSSTSGFSRQPIRAHFTFGEQQSLTLYICHLKSKRPILPTSESKNKPGKAAELCGPALSSQQRCAEAIALNLDIHAQRGQSPNACIAVIGDMNDVWGSDTLYALSGGEKDLQTQTSNSLFDAFSLLPHPNAPQRPASNYYRGRGQTLDHILLSYAFHPNNPQAQGKVTQYQLLGEHLIANGDASVTRSDHAPVVVGIDLNGSAAASMRQTLMDANTITRPRSL